MAAGRFFRRVAQATVVFVGLPLLSLCLTAGAASATGGLTVTRHTGTGISSPLEIAKGPDGALWFTNDQQFSIGRITTSGTVTHFTDPSIDDPAGIVAGPDGALWFTNVGSEQVAGSIGRITTAGTVTHFTDPSISHPESITAGPDGALWFTNTSGEGDAQYSIGRITTAGTVTHFTDPSINEPQAITTGPDGALWFTNPGNSSIGRITTTGTVTHFTEPGTNEPQAITVGPDGALWFTELGTGGGSIGRITTTGAFTHYADPNLSGPLGIAAGPDGALWITDSASGMTRITTTGSVADFSDPSFDNGVGITAGPDGALWFASEGEPMGWIGRIGLDGEPVITPGSASVAEGNSGTTSLSIPVTLSTPSTLTVTAHWTTAFVSGAPGHQADPATDYTPASGTVTFAPGKTTQNVTISVHGDTLVEPDEFIDVQFSSPTNATINGDGRGTILNDDHAKVVGGVGSALEGNSGTTPLKVPVTISNPSTQTITVQWATLFVPGAPGNQADPATDYTPASGTVTFAPGQTTQTATVFVNGDTLVEPDEYFFVVFSNPTNATLGRILNLGGGIITNDD